jgi:serine/threonine protein kinase
MFCSESLEGNLGLYMFRGGFGKVKLCYNEETKLKYAIKILDKDKLQRKFMGIGKNAYHLVENELEVLMKLVCKMS